MSNHFGLDGARLMTAVDPFNFTVDQRGLVLDWNSRARAAVGRDPPQVIGRSAAELFEPGEGSFDLSQFLIDVDIRGEAQTEAFLVEHRPVQIQGTRLDQGNQTFLVYPESGADQDWLQQIIEMSPNAILVANAEGQILLINRQLERIFGYGENELAGRTVETLIPKRFHENHRKYRSSYMLESIPRPMGMGRDLFGRRRDGSEFPVEIGLNTIETVHGLAAVASIVDITARKHWEAEVQNALAFQTSILDNAPIGLMTTDPALTITRFNQAAERILGYSEKDLINTLSPAIFFKSELLTDQAQILDPGAPIPLPAALKHIIEVIDQDQEIRTEIDLINRNGEAVPVAISTTEILGSKQERIGLLWIMADISDRRFREKQIKDALREKEILLKEVYHRVKNNLQVISSLFELQIEALSGKSAKEALVEGANRVRAMALVHEKLYRSESLSSVSTNEYIDDLFKRLDLTADRGDQAVNVTLDVDPIELGLDLAIPIGLILNELISNSFKHGLPKDRPGELTLRFKQIDDATIRLEVADNGPGFPTSFNHGEVTTLGLKLVGMLCGQLNGALQVTTGGPGAAVIIQVPYSKNSGERRL